MPVTQEQVLAYLNADEPRYEEAARFGDEAVPVLQELVAGADAPLAAKAAYLAGLIQSTAASAVVEQALQHSDPIVRVAATSTLSSAPADVARPLFERALQDDDVGVRRLALQTVPETLVPGLRATIEDRVRDDPEPGLRAQARDVLTRKPDTD